MNFSLGASKSLYVLLNQTRNSFLSFLSTHDDDDDDDDGWKGSIALGLEYGTNRKDREKWWNRSTGVVGGKQWNQFRENVIYLSLLLGVI